MEFRSLLRTIHVEVGATRVRRIRRTGFSPFEWGHIRCPAQERRWLSEAGDNALSKPR